jgi:multidrug efflux pump
MTLSELGIRRPVFAIVCSLVLLLFGAVSYFELGLREYPAVDPPIVTVSADYAGASAAVIASQITEPLEQQINGVDGIRTLSSVSSEERSRIRVEFQVGADLEAAANDVRDRVSRAIRQLPPDADPPVVEKADADSEPILFVSVQSASRPLLEVSDFADRVLKERVQTIPGVSNVRIFGEKRWAMRLWLDPLRLAAHGITPLDVQEALERQNVDLPSGRLEGSAVELSLRTAGRLETEEDFESMILREDGGRQILLRDVGWAELGAEELRSGNKSEGVPVVGVAVIPQPNTNAIAIADEFYRRLDEIRAVAPDDLEIEVGYDFTKFVRRSITEVQETIAIAFVLVGAIIFLFLRDWRATLIPVVAIPVSIVATFFVMFLAGFTINVLTLVGVVLAIGLVVDDAIVVLENVYAKVEAGRPPLEAAIEGSREIYFAVIATTITLVAVFLPIVFLTGLTGRLFREFGVVVAGAVAVSAFVALSLTPMMCRYVLRERAAHGRFHARGQALLEAVTERYRRSLDVFLGRGRLAFGLIAASLAVALLCWRALPSELAPLEDRSNIRVNVRAPEGASYEFTVHEMDRIGAWLHDTVPEIARAFAISAPGSAGGAVNSGLFSIYLKDPDQRERTQAEVFREIAGGLDQFTGVRAFPAQPPTIGDRRAGQPVQFVLQAPTLEELLEVLPRFLEAASASPVLRFVDADLKVNRPEGRVEIDRRRAAELGVSVEDVARTLGLAYGGQRFGWFLRNERQYQVIGQVQRGDRNDPGDLASLFVRARGGEMVSLDNLVRLDERVAPAAIYRHNRFTSATISAGLAPGATIGDGLAALDAIAEELLPATIGTARAGQSQDYTDAGASLLFAFGLALALIYLVLAAQFESFRDPLIILVTVPLSLAGALGGLWLTGQTLNVFSQIGLIMLIGLVTKNGILIVEFANQERAAGRELRAAIRNAAAARLRPILMTTFSTVFGILPIALSLGGAAGSRQSLGVAVVAGLVFSSGLTLYVVPAVYLALASRRAPHRETGAVAGEPAASA